jgi:hypothetical protein
VKPELAYANGQWAALCKLAGFPEPTDPTVQNSAVLGENAPKPMSRSAKNNLSAPQNPYDVSQLFSVHEQAKTRMEPRRKLSAETLCTTCRKDRHYGTCKSPVLIKKTAEAKLSDFNPGMYGGDPRMGNDPSTSPHYHAATTADSSLARAPDTQPADVQANTGFASLFLHGGIRNSSDEPGRMYGGLNKTAGIPKGLVAAVDDLTNKARKALIERSMLRTNTPWFRALSTIESRARDKVSPLQQRLNAHEIGRSLSQQMAMARADGLANTEIGDFPDLGNASVNRMRARGKLGADFFTNLPGAATHSRWEDRGPGLTPNIYEERLQVKSPPVGWGDEASQRINRGFDQIDEAVDSTCIEDTAKGPAQGPAVSV